MPWHLRCSSTLRHQLWDEILSTTVRFVIFSFTIFNLMIYRIMLFYLSLLWRNKPGQVISVATCRFTGFLGTVHYVLWQLWQLVVTRFVNTFIGWMFLNILFRFQDSTHPEQLCLARWTMSLLTAAGVDTTHSARSASALHHRRHLSVLQIHRTGTQWSLS